MLQTFFQIEKYAHLGTAQMISRPTGEKLLINEGHDLFCQQCV